MESDPGTAPPPPPPTEEKRRTLERSNSERRKTLDGSGGAGDESPSRKLSFGVSWKKLGERRRMSLHLRVDRFPLSLFVLP